jgi:hypothetical protein
VVQAARYETVTQLGRKRGWRDVLTGLTVAVRSRFFARIAQFDYAYYWVIEFSRPPTMMLSALVDFTLGHVSERVARLWNWSSQDDARATFVAAATLDCTMSIVCMD